MVAFEVLQAVRVADAYTNLVLPALLRKHQLSGRDAALRDRAGRRHPAPPRDVRRRARRPASTGRCARSRSRCSTRCAWAPTSCWRCGCRSTRRSPPPSTWCAPRSGPGAAGFANAVLRKVSRQDLDAWLAEIAPDRDTDPVAHDALVHSHPVWVVEALGEALDAVGAADEVGDPARRRQRRTHRHPGGPPRAQQPRRPARRADALLAVRRGAGLRRPRAGARRGRGRRRRPGRGLPAGGRRPGRGGARGSRRAVARPLRRARGQERAPGRPRRRARCRAAGRREGQPHRSALVARALAGADGVRGVVTADGTRPPLASGTFDRVLVDAPCTGLGALRRRPESRWRRSPHDLEVLVDLQQRLLASALDLVRPGGLVLYATCSPVLAETRGVVSEALGGACRRRARRPGPAARPGAGLRGTAGRHRAAVAAPARHRRDVPGPASPYR